MIATSRLDALSARLPQAANSVRPVTQVAKASERHGSRSSDYVVAGLLSAAAEDQYRNPDHRQAKRPGEAALQNGDNSFLTTILIMDVVNSTGIAVKLGDAKWRDIVNCHDAAAMRTVNRFDGTLHKLLGDGFISTFRQPSDAIACAQAFQEEAKGLSLSVRAGIHSGECLRTANGITGIAIAIAARVVNCTPGECIWVSSTVRELLIGSRPTFDMVGSRKLRGLPDEWVLYQVID